MFGQICFPPKKKSDNNCSGEKKIGQILVKFDHAWGISTHLVIIAFQTLRTELLVIFELGAMQKCVNLLDLVNTAQ